LYFDRITGYTGYKSNPVILSKKFSFKPFKLYPKTRFLGAKLRGIEPVVGIETMARI